MKVSSLTVDPFTNMPIVVLKDIEGRKAVPIWIGLVEASAIATELESIRLDRPMTHDLMKTLLESCECKVERIEVHDLKSNTFYATIHLQRKDGSTFAVDARPSDAIALALRSGATIFVAQKVIDRARKIDLRLGGALTQGSVNPTGLASGSAEIPKDMILEALTETAFGKWKM
jgi:bifunctional DNase/RNase